ncbi:TPA: hypothetical protein G5V04_005199 [Salmonella enterica]|nr:hypothetical protein [Salmonella enterica]
MATALGGRTLSDFHHPDIKDQRHVLRFILDKPGTRFLCKGFGDIDIWTDPTTIGQDRLPGWGQSNHTD